MVGIDIEYKLDHFILALQDKGIMDHNIDDLIDERGLDKPRAVVDAIHFFLTFTRANIQEINRQLNYEEISFQGIKDFLGAVEINSTCAGMLRLLNVCKEMIEACNRSDERMCRILFASLAHEFYIISKALDVILEMEDVIVKRLIRQKQALRNAPSA